MKKTSLDENIVRQLEIANDLLYKDADVYNENFIIKAQELAQLILEMDSEMRGSGMLPERWIITKTDIPTLTPKSNRSKTQ